MCILNVQILGLGRWLKDGEELSDQQKYFIVNDARSGILSLTVIRATEVDIGQYECEVLEPVSTNLKCIKITSIANIRDLPLG